MANNTKDFIVEQLKKQIENFKAEDEQKTFGLVTEVGDGIARVSGLSEAMMSEMLEFKTKSGSVYGVALNLDEEVPVGENVIGRVLDPLGKALDGKGEIKTEKYYPVEKIAPGVMTRESVSEPVQTGIKPIDAMIPIGRGQRELIIGDRQIGKTAIAVDTIINQKGKNMKCV